MKSEFDENRLDKSTDNTSLQYRYTESECLINGFLEECKNKLEEAYKWYLIAANAGNANGMRCIANLYFYKKFHPIMAFRMDNVLLNIQDETYDSDSIYSKIADYKRAFDWYLKAAVNGDIDSMNDVGVLYYGGIGCSKDIEMAKLWLKKAVDNDDKHAILAYSNLFGEIKNKYKSDEEYFKLLKEFEKCADTGNEARCSILYKHLVVGTEKQLLKFGYVLAKGKYSVGGIYQKFSYPRRKNGEPYAPVYIYKRYNWTSILKINLDCFDEESSKIGFSTDIMSSLEPLKWLKKCDEITYKSGEFGWLGEIKKCSVMLINKNNFHDSEALVGLPYDIECKSKLHKDNAAFFIEHGEKEYSVEICHIKKNGQIVILYRYTMDGYDQGERPSKIQII